MNHTFVTGASRQIISANFNLYEKPVYHPDRILGEHDIFCILEGSWVVGQDGISYALEKGDYIILRSGKHHYGIDKCEPGTRTMYMHIESMPGDILTEGEEEGGGDNLVYLPTVIRCKDAIETFSIFEDIILTFWSDLPNKKIKLAALLDLLLFELSITNQQHNIIVDKLVNDALSMIRLSGEKIYTLAELSHNLHVCSRILTDRFKRATGKTIHKYQIDLKLEMAYMAIKYEQKRSFKELAMNFGFYDEFHFSKLFKKKYGFAPSKLK